MFGIEYSKAAIRTLRRIPANTAALIRGKVGQLADDPRAVHAQLRPLAGSDAYRLRVGGWRVILRIDDAAQVIRIVLIAPRGKAYR